MIGVRLEGANVLLVRLGAGAVHAYDDRCPHAGARLSEGRLCAAALRCSAHHWEFDLRTGEGINPRKCRLWEHGVQIVEGEVLVQLRRPSRV